jgi:hypothetical protein
MGRVILSMLIILPIATFILFGYYLLKFKTSIREAILSAFLLWSCCLVVITEVLSFFKIINLPSISIAWVSILSGLACLCFRISKNKLNVSKIDFKIVDLFFGGQYYLSPLFSWLLPFLLPPTIRTPRIITWQECRIGYKIGTLSIHGLTSGDLRRSFKITTMKMQVS